MANEIRVTTSLQVQRYTSNVAAAAVAGNADSYTDLLDNDIGAATQTFSTSGSAVSDAGVTSPRYKYIKNTSSSGNLILYGDSGFTQRHQTLRPGEGVPIHDPPSLWAKASTGTVTAHIAAAKAAAP